MISLNEKLLDSIARCRSHALYIKSNILLLQEYWNLIDEFKKANAGFFYASIQQNSIFRITLESWKLFVDEDSRTNGFRLIANEICNSIRNIDDENDAVIKEIKEAKAKLKNYSNTINRIRDIRHKVYAHSEKEYYWYNVKSIEQYGLTDQIYDDLISMAEIVIDICNFVLGKAGIKAINHYRNYDDVRRVFGMDTRYDEDARVLKELLRE